MTASLFLLAQRPYPHESCTNHAVGGSSPLCSAGSSAPRHGHKCPTHRAPGQLCRERSPALGGRGTQSISNTGRGEKEDFALHMLLWCRCLFVIMSQCAFFFFQKTMAKVLKHRTLWKGKEVQSLLEPSCPLYTSASCAILDTAKTFGSVSTGDCSTKSQSSGQATALGRRSGGSTGKYAFPGGQGSPGGMPCHQVLQAWWQMMHCIKHR